MPEIINGHKKCSTCLRDLPVSSFWRGARYLGGYRSACKACEMARDATRKVVYAERASILRKKDYANDPIKYQTRNSFRNLRRRLEVLHHYSSGALCCACCGEGHMEFLGIDHIDGNGAAHRRAIGVRAGSSFYWWLKREGYPEGYRVLCHNCNMAYGFYRRCPHQEETHVRTDCPT